MKVAVAALIAALLGCGSAPPPAVTVTVTQPVVDIGIATALKHTALADDLGCTVVDVGGGVVVTAKHCVDELEAGAMTEVGVVVYQDEKLDFALLYDLSKAEHSNVEMRAPKFGERVYTVGYPVQLATRTQELTVTDGLFAGPAGNDGELRITAPIYFGNSGGGCWGTDGALVGITVSGFLDLPGMNFIVPANLVEDALGR